MGGAAGYVKRCLGQGHQDASLLGELARSA